MKIMNLQLITLIPPEMAGLYLIAILIIYFVGIATGMYLSSQIEDKL